MDQQLIYFSSYEMFISIVFGLLTVFIATRFINLVLLKTEQDHRNVSTAIFSGGLVVCALVLVESSVLPSVDALRTMVLGQEQLTLKILAISLGYFLAFYALAVVISILVIYAAIRIHMAATLDVDEIKEIREDNVAQSILLTAVLLGMTYFIQEPTSRLISSLVDYESLEQIEAGPIIAPEPETETMVIPSRRLPPDSND